MESITKYFEIIKEKRFKMALKYTTNKKKKKEKKKKKRKKTKETASVSCMTNECDVFNNVLDNEDCRAILLNHLKIRERT